MSYYNTVIEKYQGAIPRKFEYKFTRMIKGHNNIDVIHMTNEGKCHIERKGLTKGFYKYKGEIRLSRKYFINSQTGEVEKMPIINGNQMRCKRSLRKIFTDLRRLIETNFQGGESNKFLTLTYRGEEQHNDPKKIFKDLDIFTKRLKRAYANIGYIHIVEPHASGNYHVHSLIKIIDGSPLNMTTDDIFKLWGHGWVTVETLNNVDNIGAYFIAYFSNMEIADEDLHKYKDDIKEVPRADGSGMKKVIKGKRMDFYPDYMKIYRNSLNLKKPMLITEIPDDFTKSFEQTYKITSTDTEGNSAESYLKKEQHKRKK